MSSCLCEKRRHEAEEDVCLNGPTRRSAAPDPGQNRPILAQLGHKPFASEELHTTGVKRLGLGHWEWNTCPLGVTDFSKARKCGWVLKS